MRPALAFRSLSYIWFILSVALVSLSHHSHPGFGKSLSELEKSPSPAVFERFHGPHDLGDLHEFDEPKNKVRFEKRGAIRVDARTGEENAELYNAWHDMLYLVKYVYNNWTNIDPVIFDVYFHPFHIPKVKQIASTVLQMAQQGGVTNIASDLQGYQPTDFDDILLLRARGAATRLGESFGVGAEDNSPRIYIYDFGWQVLKKRRFLYDYPADCSKIGSKVDYRMQFLGGLVLHETLHFHNVGQLAWNRKLDDDQVIDDQEGTFCGLRKAYGPYQARKLRQVDYDKALLNNENYVWFFLHAFWSMKCPQNMPISTQSTTGRAFILPESNDIPKVCYKSFIGLLGTTWCWFS